MSHIYSTENARRENKLFLVVYGHFFLNKIVLPCIVLQKILERLKEGYYTISTADALNFQPHLDDLNIFIVILQYKQMLHRKRLFFLLRQIKRGKVRV